MNRPAMIGSAPDSWGVWFPDAPGRLPRSASWTWKDVAAAATLTAAMGAPHLVVIPDFRRDPQTGKVEQDMCPCPADRPLPIATRTLTYLQSCGPLG